MQLQRPNNSTNSNAASRSRHDAPPFPRELQRWTGRHRAQRIARQDQRAPTGVKIDPADPSFAPRPSPLPAKVKNVIYLFMAGGPSQLELFDYKPKLVELSGKTPPKSMMDGRRFAFLKGNETLLGTTRKFGRYGQCGMTLSELIPHHRKIVDDVCWLRGMTTDVFNHGPAKLFMNTGFQAPGRPSMGSWVTYGLGSGAIARPARIHRPAISARAGRVAAVRCGAAAFFPHLSRACPSATAAMRFSIGAVRLESRRNASAISTTRSAR